jgi:hypothetical protein
MATTNFATGTLIESTWLNDVDQVVYDSDGAAYVDFTPTGTGAVVRSVAAKLKDTVSVLDFGADPTGATDSTAAFNLATGAAIAGTGFNGTSGIATDTWAKTVEVPAGQYRITGTVYVHKGQHLRGAGEGATRILLTTTSAYASPIFKLGFSTIGEDAGGLPPEISGMWTFGGPSSNYVISATISGFSVHNFFMTSCGGGIEATGTDGRVENIQIDQALVGFYVGGHNNLFNNILVYSPNYGMLTVSGAGSTCSDNTFTNMHMYYVAYSGVRLSSGVTHSNLSFNSCNFLLNVQHATFEGFITAQCNTAKNISFNDCTFSNMKGAAFSHTNGIDNEITFYDCIFDGNKTVAAYAQSTTAFAATCLNEEIIFQDCEFKNLLAVPIQVNGSTATCRVMVRGGVVSNCTGTVIMSIGATVPTNGSQLTVERVFCKDQIKTAFTSGTSGWFLATDMAMILPGNGATTILEYPSGSRSSYFVNTTTVAAKVRLPRSDDSVYVKPKHGDKLTFIDYAQTWNTNNVTFLCGSGNINGAAADYVANTNGATKTFTYNSVTNNWNVS